MSSLQISQIEWSKVSAHRSWSPISSVLAHATEIVQALRTCRTASRGCRGLMGASWLSGSAACHRTAKPKMVGNMYRSFMCVTRLPQSLENELVHELDLYFKIVWQLIFLILCSKSGQFFLPRGKEKKKKIRTLFSNLQINELERRFAVRKYLRAHECEQLAGMLHLTKRQVQIWFQNRRYKEKKRKANMKKLTASIPVAESSPQVLPTSTVQTPLNTLPGFDYFKHPLMQYRPSPISLQDLCYPPFHRALRQVPSRPNSFCCPYPPVPFPHTHSEHFFRDFLSYMTSNCLPLHCLWPISYMYLYLPFLNFKTRSCKRVSSLLTGYSGCRARDSLVPKLGIRERG